MAKKILIEDLKIGMKFSAPLFTNDNNVVLESGVIIKDQIYNRFVRWGIKELYTEGELIPGEDDIKKTENSSEESISKKNYIEIYNRSLSAYEGFIEDVIKNKSYNKDLLNEVIIDILDLVARYKNDIISYMALENDKYDYLITHAINTAVLAIIGGYELKLDEKKIKDLGIAALLHDLGMLNIPKEILNKKDKLLKEEYNIIKAHPITTYKQLSTLNIFNQEILDAILQHHEQFDGNGYPRKLKENKINLFAKIIAIADTFEAQITRRVYRETKTGYLAMKSVLAEAKNKFDPHVLRAFLTTLSIYPPGTLLQLNNNSICTVVSINSDAPLRPKVRIIVDEFGDKITNNLIKDLKEESELFIVNVLNKDEYKKKS